MKNASDPTREEAEIVVELLGKGLQRGDVAAAIWMTPEQFDQLVEAGCSPNATPAQRAFAKLVFEEENKFKAQLIQLAMTSKNAHGPLQLLQLRFKATWGRDAKPAADAIPNSVVDWEAALGELLSQEDGPLQTFLLKHGYSRSAAP